MPDFISLCNTGGIEGSKGAFNFGGGGGGGIQFDESYLSEKEKVPHAPDDNYGFENSGLRRNDSKDTNQNQYKNENTWISIGGGGGCGSCDYSSNPRNIPTKHVNRKTNSIYQSAGQNKNNYINNDNNYDTSDNANNDNDNNNSNGSNNNNNNDNNDNSRNNGRDSNTDDDICNQSNERILCGETQDDDSLTESTNRLTISNKIKSFFNILSRTCDVLEVTGGGGGGGGTAECTAPYSVGYGFSFLLSSIIIDNSSTTLTTSSSSNHSNSSSSSSSSSYLFPFSTLPPSSPITQKSSSTFTAEEHFVKKKKKALRNNIDSRRKSIISRGRHKYNFLSTGEIGREDDKYEYDIGGGLLHDASILCGGYMDWCCVTTQASMRIKTCLSSEVDPSPGVREHGNTVEKRTSLRGSDRDRGKYRSRDLNRGSGIGRGSHRDKDKDRDRHGNLDRGRGRGRDQGNGLKVRTVKEKRRRRTEESEDGKIENGPTKATDEENRDKVQHGHRGEEEEEGGVGEESEEEGEEEEGGEEEGDEEGEEGAEGNGNENSDGGEDQEMIDDNIDSSSSSPYTTSCADIILAQNRILWMVTIDFCQKYDSPYFVGNVTDSEGEKKGEEDDEEEEGNDEKSDTYAWSMEEEEKREFIDRSVGETAAANKNESENLGCKSGTPGRMRSESSLKYLQICLNGINDNNNINEIYDNDFSKNYYSYSAVISNDHNRTREHYNMHNNNYDNERNKNENKHENKYENKNEALPVANSKNKSNISTIDLKIRDLNWTTYSKDLTFSQMYCSNNAYVHENLSFQSKNKNENGSISYENVDGTCILYGHNSTYEDDFNPNNYSYLFTNNKVDTSNDGNRTDINNNENLNFTMIMEKKVNQDESRGDVTISIMVYFFIVLLFLNIYLSLIRYIYTMRKTDRNNIEEYALVSAYKTDT